ncbi:hypothetical protein BCR33DRAFT_856866 [Rhizoclosmatium globosum]|uniref:Zn(2)-C6 fungal-type domain-containing protein n=1 Tax=Rhizoclosmatium globosum TaxID=329046 RepID=A0A1Y2B9I3_9FUNG|nr:hypothetical protein BCR33DRAFT_856866 [Rhizoclosmatium globosum]|eukprot:ORY31489.1 hypothetical protein BCR33DRAFT_856866 [Rhizoclosmatium globosum]
MPPSLHRCKRCLQGHRKCVPGPDNSACERCVRLGKEGECVYELDKPLVSPTTDDASTGSVGTSTAFPTISLALDRFMNAAESSLMDLDTDEWRDQAPTTLFGTQCFNSTALQQYMKAFETPMFDHGDKSMDLEDPDLMCTFDDWMLVFNWLSRNGTRAIPIARWMDAESMLKEFFYKPPALRLILCCSALQASYFSSNRSNPNAELSYFRRARKAFYRAELSSADMVSFYFYLGLQASDIGEMKISEQCLRSAIELIIDLKMDVDPDDSPWLSHLTARQREERRRFFWIIYIQYSHVVSYSVDAPEYNFNSDKIKPPSQVYDPHPVFVNVTDIVKWETLLLNIIGTIKRANTLPPQSVSALADSTAVNTPFHNQLLSAHSSISTKWLLLFENPAVISPQDEDRFITQVSLAKDILFDLNMLLQVSTSVFYRPLMFLSGLRSCDPVYLSSNHQTAVLNAINQCLEASWRISSLYLFYDKMMKGDDRIHEDEVIFYQCDFGTYQAFEAFIVFWFIACRMESQWLSLAGLTEFNNSALRERLRKVFEIVRSMGSVGSSDPILQAMEAMLAEVEEAGRLGRWFRSLPDDVILNDLEAIEVGMKLMRVGTDMEENSVVDPYCYMGFLGMEIGSRRKIRWKGRREESWRLFWKLNG